MNFTVRDLFATCRKKTSANGTGFSQVVASYPHGRVLGISISYNFGNLKGKKRNEMAKNQELPEMEPDDEFDSN